MPDPLTTWRLKNPLLRWREANGKSLADVARIVGRSRSLVDRWEKGLVQSSSGWRLWMPTTPAFWSLHRAGIVGTAFSFEDWLAWINDVPPAIPGTGNYDSVTQFSAAT